MPPSPAQDERGRRTVLVVDDDPLQRREIVRCLSDLGIATHEAENGWRAVEAIRTLRPAVVIMDIRMPVMDGVEAARVVAARMCPRPKILLVTGDPESFYRANRSRADVFAVIEKPVPLRALSRFVLAALEPAADVNGR